MKLVVALGGNALLRRGQPMTAENQRANIRIACEALAPVVAKHQLTISHGNGPQVGLLSLQAAAYHDVDPYPLDLLGAQTEGMIGYLIEQEMGNLLPFEQPLASLLTMTEVDADDPAFHDPTKFVGPIYTQAEAAALHAAKGWAVKPDGDHWRRVVPSPVPKRIFQVRPIKQLVDSGVVVICTGGGGIPTMYLPGSRTLVGVEAVIDKDLASGVLARELEVDLFVMATDADAVYLDWGTPSAKAISAATPEALERFSFPAGSMGPKVRAACDFVRETGAVAAIGALEDLSEIIEGRAGTVVRSGVEGDIHFR